MHEDIRSDADDGIVLARCHASMGGRGAFAVGIAKAAHPDLRIAREVIRAVDFPVAIVVDTVAAFLHAPVRRGTGGFTPGGIRAVEIGEPRIA